MTIAAETDRLNASTLMKTKAEILLIRQKLKERYETAGYADDQDTQRSVSAKLDVIDSILGDVPEPTYGPIVTYGSLSVSRYPEQIIIKIGVFALGIPKKLVSKFVERLLVGEAADDINDKSIQL